MPENEFIIEPLRLIEAADAVAEVLREVAESGTGRCPYPPSMLQMPDHPERLDEFSSEELVEATAFLCRLGVLVHRAG
ncbi:MAG: hypothetical protein IPJ41_05765 [Phycisphaerales bacterium]|nr:hypothetical protein [Phycisphaerales bacterium]